MEARFWNKNCTIRDRIPYKYHREHNITLYLLLAVWKDH